MAERLKATVLKTVRRVTVSGVRIPPPSVNWEWAGRAVPCQRPDALDVTLNPGRCGVPLRLAHRALLVARDLVLGDPHSAAAWRIQTASQSRGRTVGNELVHSDAFELISWARCFRRPAPRQHQGARSGSFRLTCLRSTNNQTVAVRCVGLTDLLMPAAHGTCGERRRDGAISHSSGQSR